MKRPARGVGVGEGDGAEMGEVRVRVGPFPSSVSDSDGSSDAGGEDLASRAKRKRRERDEDDMEYNDDLVFDNIKHLLPGAERGKYLLLLSLVLQTVVVVLALLSHHHKTRDFDCCNMVAVAVAAFFLIIQVPYVADWFGQRGNNPQWHRGNLFVPFVFMVVSLWEWGAGVVSMMAQAIGVDVFEWVNVSDLSFWEGLAFLVCSGTLGACVIIFFVVDYTHRNNIGEHYYFVEEKAGALIEIKDERTPNIGTFELPLVRWLVTAFQVHTSRAAENNLPRLITIGTLLQVPFYLFATIAYTVGRESTVAPIVIMGVGVLSFAFNWQYFVGAITRRSKKTRSWNRINLWYPSKVAFVMIVVYFVTMANMFFSTTDRDLHEALPDLDTAERAYLWTNTAMFAVLVVVQLLLGATHRKVWAEEREMGLGVRDPLEVRAATAIMGIAVDKDELERRDEDDMTWEEMMANEPEGADDDDMGPGYNDDEPGAQPGAEPEETADEFNPRKARHEAPVKATSGGDSDSDSDGAIGNVSVASRQESSEGSEPSDDDDDEKGALASKSGRASTEHFAMSARLRAATLDGQPESGALGNASDNVLYDDDDDDDDGLLAVTDA